MTTLPVIVLTLLLSNAPVSDAYFGIQIVDSQTGRGVPLVELRTVNDQRFVSDSNGWVALHEPGLVNQEVYFHIRSHGYEFVADGFKYRGKRLKIVPGRRVVLKLKRLNIAERIYRVTGGGIYRDSLLLGQPTPLAQPVLNAQVFGSDSVVNAVYRDQIYWFWGDTNRASYPLGNYQVPGATSPLPAKSTINVDQGINLSYFINAKGFAKETCAMPGPGPTWIDGLVVLEDAQGSERLFARYAKVKSPLTIYERGLVEWNDKTQEFKKYSVFDQQAPLYPAGHPFIHQDNGQSHVYFAQGLPYVRVAANPQAMADTRQYEAYTCFHAGDREKSFSIERDSAGKICFAWKRDTLPLTLERQQQLVAGKKMTRDEGLFRTVDAHTGKPVNLARGSVYWNAYRQRWLMIGCQVGGTSYLGEIWYAEADTPVGPWNQAIKIVTHEKYSFYNPKQHPMLSQQGGRFVYFEGTYTNTFTSNREKTPRYDYNQVMYRLDLADNRLKAIR
ncbi:MAG: hypothetical protein VB877_05695 [Pirellulaceae bacterium]